MKLEAYLRDNDAQKQIDKLAKRCKNKKVVFYGAGKFLNTLIGLYNLEEFNVVGLCDRSFKENNIKNKTSYLAVSPEDLVNYDYDVIIITTLWDYKAMKYLLRETLKDRKDKNFAIYPIIVPTFSYLIKLFFAK